MIVDEEGKIILVNAQTEIQFGYTRREMLGQQVEMLIPERYRGPHHGHRENYFLNPYTREMGASVELSGRRKDGSEFPAEIRLGMLKTDKGFLATSVIRDTSDRKRAEKEAAHRLRELERLTNVAATILDVFENTADEAAHAAVLTAVLSGFNCVSGCFVRFDDEDALVGSCASGATHGEGRWPADEWNPLWQRALEGQEVVLSEEACRLTSSLEVSRSLVVPILSQGTPVGLLHIADAPRPFDDVDADLLDRVARLIGPVLDARIQRDREERERKRAESQLENYRAEFARALREPFDRADAASQRQAAVGAGARHRRHDRSHRMLSLTLLDFVFELKQLPIPQSPLSKQLVHFQPIDFAER